MTTLRSAPPGVLLPEWERRVLALLAEGHRDREVAVRLGLASTQRVHYRVGRIGAYFGLESATRPQLVDLAYTHGALPAPEPLQPLVLSAAEYHLVRMLAAGGTIGAHARAQGLTRYQVTRIVRKAQSVLEAATLPALIRRAWQRQVLGPTAFAADLAMHARHPAEPGPGHPVIVPLASGHRLALPARGPHRIRYLDVSDTVEARAAARFLSGRDGYAPLWITEPAHRDEPVRVCWGRPEAIPPPGRASARGRPGRPRAS